MKDLRDPQNFDDTRFKTYIARETGYEARAGLAIHVRSCVRIHVRRPPPPRRGHIGTEFPVNSLKWIHFGGLSGSPTASS